jgi:hypothetical protein
MLGAMSREDLVKSAITAVNRRDVDAYLACCTDDISAGVAGEITKTSDPSQAPVGNSFLMRYEDLGEPGSDAVSPDRVRAIQFGFPLTTCPQDVGTFPIEQGNYVVHDSLLP